MASSPKKPYQSPELRKYSSPLDLPPSLLSSLEDLISTALIASVNEHRVYQSVSPAFASLLGYTPEELKGKRVDDITAQNTVDIDMVFEALRRIGELEGLWLFQHRKGNKVLVHFHAKKRDHLMCAEFEPLTIAS